MSRSSASPRLRAGASAASLTGRGLLPPPAGADVRIARGPPVARVVAVRRRLVPLDLALATLGSLLSPHAAGLPSRPRTGRTDADTYRLCCCCGRGFAPPTPSFSGRASRNDRDTRVGATIKLQGRCHEHFTCVGGSPSATGAGHAIARRGASGNLYAVDPTCQRQCGRVGERARGSPPPRWFRPCRDSRGTCLAALGGQKGSSSADGPIKTFSLRGMRDTPPYLHDGRLPRAL